MHICVFGAAGRTGRHIVDRALGHGHEVTAFVRETPLELENAEGVRVVRGDVLDYDAVFEAIAGCTAVAFALSHGSGSGRHIMEEGIGNVIHAMAEQGVSRLAAVSAAGTFSRTSKRLSIAARAMIATTLRPVYDDLEAMELLIMASDLDWTIVRPVGLSDDPPTGHYRISLDGSLLPKTSRIPRSDVAALVLKALETDTYWRRSVVIAE
jgi:putative NADH-flavin reductase